MKVVLEKLNMVARKLVDGFLEPSDAAYELYKLSCESEYRPMISKIAFIEEVEGFPDNELKLTNKQQDTLFKTANYVLSELSLEKIEAASERIVNLRKSLYKTAKEYLDHKSNAVYAACEIHRFAYELDEHYLINMTTGIVDEASEIPWDSELRKKYDPDLLERMDKQAQELECWSRKDVEKTCQWIVKNFAKHNLSQ